MMTAILLFLFLGTAWGSNSFEEQARFTPQPVVSFANWGKTMPFRVLDVQGQSALLEVEVKPLSEDCEELDDCLPVYRIERWRLPYLALEGVIDKPVVLGEVVAARLVGTETFFFYRDQLIITNEALNVLERVSYPESLQGRLDHGSPVIGVAGSGDFAFVNNHLWDRQRRDWHADQRWKLISPDIEMGDHMVMALGSFHSGEVWLVPYQAPERSQRFQARDVERIFLSPDERRLLIEQRKGLHRLIDVDKLSEVERWKQRIHYQRLSWRHNRSLAVERNGKWTLHQIEPHQVIARGSQKEGGFAIVSGQLPIGVFFDLERNMANMIHLGSGHALGQQELPELSESYAWLGQDVPLAYSQRPLTLLLDGGLSKRGIQQFRPYRLEMREVPVTKCDSKE